MILVSADGLDQLATANHQGPWTWSLVNSADGTVWSPSAGKFVAGDQAADGVRPLALIAGDKHVGQAVALDASIPDPGPDDGWLVDVHDVGGAVVLSIPVGTPRQGNASVALAVSIHA